MTDAEKKSPESKGVTAFNTLVAVGFLVSGLALWPFIFDDFFSFMSLMEFEVKPLKYFSVAILLLGIFTFLLRRKISAGMSMTSFSFLLILWIELFFRAFINADSSQETDQDLYLQSNWTYPELVAYEGNPFLHFAGKRNIELKGSKALTSTSPFNNFGFVGGDMFQYKPKNVLRVACLGESTTADGYPAVLQDYINENHGELKYRFEVYNFGQAYWTSAHSAANFLFNIRDFQPDVIVIHHGWNEEKVRNYPDSVFRNDYSHAFKSFSTPYVYDRYLIRISGLYRYFKFRFDKSPAWVNLANTVQTDTPHTEMVYSSQKELMPFHRNIKSIIDLALAGNIKVIIATLPHSTNAHIPMYYAYKSIDQCNAISRELAAGYKSEVALVDLDSLMSGKMNNVFTDLGHVNDSGRQVKAKFIGERILELYSGNEAMIAPQTVWKDNFSIDGQQYYSKIMFANPTWMKDLESKSKKMNLSLDSVMRSDAYYIYKHDDLGL